MGVEAARNFRALLFVDFAVIVIFNRRLLCFVHRVLLECCNAQLSGADAEFVSSDNCAVSGLQSRRFGWWYLCIGIGFVLLALVHMIQGPGFADVALRFAVAVGFGLLGLMQLRFGR